MKIFIGNLHCNASEHDLYNLFRAFGTILSVTMHLNQSGIFSSYGYLIMKEDVDGHKAIWKLDGINFMNQFLEIYEVL